MGKLIRSIPDMTVSRCARITILCFILGLIPGSINFTPPTWYMAVPLVVGLILCWSMRKPPKMLFVILLSATSLWAGWLYVSTWRSVEYRTFRSGFTTGVRGVITQPADIREKDILYTVSITNPVARTLSNQKVNGSVLVTAPLVPVYHYGDEIRFSGQFSSPHPFSGFNYPLFLERFKIYAEVRFVHNAVLLRRNRGNWLFAKLYELKAHIEIIIKKSLPEPQASVMTGILLGEKRSIPLTIQTALQNTGTVHIIVTSGSNITILVEILGMMLVFKSRKASFYSIINVSLFFSLLTGAPASVLRGAMVVCGASYVRMRSRRAWPISFVLISMLLLLLGNPLLLVGDPGFQVSFAAFSGLAFFGEHVSQFIEKMVILKKLPTVIKQSISASLAATIGISGVSLHLFGQLSFLGLIVNPIALWLLVPITFLGLLLATLGDVILMGKLLAMPINLLLKLEIGVIQFFGRSSIGIIHANLSWISVGAMYLVIALFFRKMQPRPPN